MAVTTTREVFVSEVVILRPGGLTRARNVVVTTTTQPRDRMEVTLHVDDKDVVITLTASDRRVLIEALGGSPS